MLTFSNIKPTYRGPGTPIAGPLDLYFRAGARVTRYERRAAGYGEVVGVEVHALACECLECIAYRLEESGRDGPSCDAATATGMYDHD